MAKINIPEQHIKGFAEISKMTKDQAQGLAEYLDNVPISIEINKTLDGVDEYLSSQLKIKSSAIIVGTVVSFSDLVKSDEEDQLANDLTNAYVEQNLEVIGKNKIEHLKENLKIIIRSFKRISLIFKAYELAYGNDKIFNEGKIISDVRILFDEKIKDKARHAIILHKLLIKFSNSNKREDLFFTMDLEDLKNLKSSIELAIENDAVIKNDYKNNLNFI